MAKKKTSIAADPIEELVKEAGVEKIDVYETSVGAKIRLKAISPTLLAKVHQSVPQPKVPTYEVEIAGGGTQTFYHDAESVKGDEEAEKAWSEYRQAVIEAEAERNQRMTRVLILKGTEVDLPEDNDWIELQEFMGLTIPDNRLERYIHYVETELLGGPEDIMGLMEAISSNIGISEEEIREAEKQFRNSMGNGGSGAGTVGTSENGAQQMADKPAL